MRKTSILAAAGLAFSPLLLAQETPKQHSPTLPAEILGPPLVAWSQLQKPRPVSQPIPPPDRVDQPLTGQPALSRAQQASPLDAAQTFAGSIVKDNGKYVLKVSESTAYQIDNQEKARTYDGKQVRIIGNLDSKTNMLHITRIELLS